jgi:TonB family protein
MIVAWLTYCVLVAALLGSAAWVGERAVRAQGWSGRWPWALALGGSLALPLAAWLRPGSPADVATTSVMPMPGAYVMESLPPLMLHPVGTAAPSLEMVLLWGWAAASGLLLLYLAVSGLRVRAEGRLWRRGEVDGVAVMVSAATGPAALGLFRGRVVLPEWALSLDDRLRRLLVLHEAEHVRAKDPQLALAGLVACALMPWNVALWWQLARLRLAIEVDCDARVLRQYDDAAGYGTLLLEVGQRRARLAVGLAESRSMLERRIRMITSRELGRRTARALGLGAVATLVLAVACETPPPTGLADVASQPLSVEQVLSGSELPCEPVVFVDNVVTSMAGLAGLDPDAVASVDVIRGGAAQGIGELRLEPPAGGQAVRPDPRCGLVLIVTKDASPEAADRTRRLKETLLAQRAEGSRTAADPDPAADPVFTPMTVRPQLRNGPEVVQALRDHYPPLLRDAGVSGTATVWLFIDEEGAVQEARLHEGSGHAALDQAALRVARTMEFTPAYNRDVRVPVWVSLPMTFETGAPARDADVGRAFDEHTALREGARAARERRVRETVGQMQRSAVGDGAPTRAGAPVAEGVAVDPGADPVFTPMTARPLLLNSRDVRDALMRHYPPLLRDAGIGGTARIWLFIDEQGVVRRTRLAAGSGYDALDQAAMQVAAAMQFRPARNRDQPVPVWIALPVTFGTE